VSDPPAVSEGIALVFDREVHSLIAIKKAAYRFLDRFSANITIDGKRINCVLSFPASSDHHGRTRLAEDFRKEVLDQDLRETLKAETEPTRNLILAYAFSKTGMVSDKKIP
jgi:His-Xaa-Ser system protein HxsD